MLSLDKIRSQFEGFWTTSRLGVPVEYENVADTDELSEAKRRIDIWARMTIREGETNQASIGDNPLNRTVGIIFLSYFTKRDSGTAALRKLHDVAAAAIIAQPNLDGIWMRRPSFTINGIEENIIQATSSIPFQADQYSR